MQGSSVIILHSHPLYAEGIRRLLSEVEGIEVVDSIDIARPDVAQVLAKAKPDVIVVEADDGGASHGLTLSTLRRKNPGSLLLSLGLSDRTMRVYYKRQVVSAKPEDLKAVVRLQTALSGWSTEAR